MPQTLQIVGLPLIHFNAAAVDVLAHVYDMFYSANCTEPTDKEKLPNTPVERLDTEANRRLYNAEDDDYTA